MALPPQFAKKGDAREAPAKGGAVQAAIDTLRGAVSSPQAQSALKTIENEIANGAPSKKSSPAFAGAKEQAMSRFRDAK